MAALMSCSVFACIISGSDFGADDLQGECSEATHTCPPLRVVLPPSHPIPPSPQSLLLLSLALELHDRGFIPRIFPLLVSDGGSIDDVAAQYEADADVVHASTAQLLQVSQRFSCSSRKK
jgi:hypothetical protein